MKYGGVFKPELAKRSAFVPRTALFQIPNVFQNNPQKNEEGTPKHTDHKLGKQ